MCCRAVRRGSAENGSSTSACQPSFVTMRCGRALFGCRAEACASAAARQAETCAASAARPAAGSGRMTDTTKSRALREIAFCEGVLAKAGLNVLAETFRETDEITAWEHYPPGDVFDPASGAQWFYHCHPAEEGAEEHGHFHCFVRPGGADGPIHHLAAVGVDAHGRILRLFTVNQWVVGDEWLEAEPTIALLPRFDMQMPRPSYLVNRWLTAVFAAYEDEIAALIRARDRTIEAYAARPDVPVRDDRKLEVTSELRMAVKPDR